MSIPGFVDEEVEIFPEVEASLIAYMRHRKCSFDMALSHALRVLGGVDVAKQAGEEIFQIPGHAIQSEVKAYHPIYGQEIYLEKLGQNISSKPQRIPVQLHEKAYNSLRAYTQGRAIPQAVAVMHAAFLLVLCQHGDLWVRPPGKQPLQMTLEQ